MKKLLIMASLFWPQKKSGGPPISIMNVAMAVREKFDIYIISNNHELNSSEKLPGIEAGWNTFFFGKAYYIPNGEHNFKTVMRLVEEVQPDVIYQNSFFSVNDLLPVLVYKKKHRNVKVIVAPRGELYPERMKKGYTKKTIYSKLFRHSGLLKDVYFQGTGEEECEQEHTILGIPASHLYNVQNLSMVSGDSDYGIEKKPGELRLVFVARVHPTKNIVNAIEWLGSVNGNVVYHIYGSIEDLEYWKQCQVKIAQLPKNITVEYKGLLEHNQVPEVLKQYHGYYMPTTGENFGHSIVEAMLIGRPVIISDQTPWTSVNGHGGWAIPLLDRKGFAAALNRLCACSEEEFSMLSGTIRAYIREQLNTDQIIEQYIKMFCGE